MKFTSRIASPLASAIAALLASSSIHAGQIWDGGSSGPGDNNWNTAANWDSNILPTFTNAITFVGNTRNGAVNNLAADSTIGGIDLTNDGSTGKTNAFTLSGTRITLGGNINTTANTAGSTITDTISLNMILNGDRTITTNQQSSSVQHNLTISGIISQDGSNRKLIKQGSGRLSLTVANSYAGGTTISAGSIRVTHSSALGSGSVSVASGAVLFLDTNSLTVANDIELNGISADAAINNNAPSGGNVTNLTGKITLNTTSNITTHWNDKTLQLSGKITGAGGLNFDLNTRSGAVGGRYLITGATNDYAGATSITGRSTPNFGFTGQAMLYLGATNALPTTSALTLNYADLYLNGQSQTLPSISGGGSFSVQNGSTTAATLTLGSGDTTSTFSGTIKDNGFSVTNTAATAPTLPTLPPTLVTGTVALTKTGNGTLTLSGTNAYTGATNVNGGKLIINGSTSSTSLVTVANGATLGGSGAIGGGVTVQGGGTFSPGNSIESLTTGNLTLLAGATFAQEIDKSAAPGVSGDLTATTGSLSITAGAILTLNELGTSGAWQAGDKIALIGYSTGTWNGGLFTYLGNTLNDDSNVTFSGIHWTFNYNDITFGDNYQSDISAFTGSARYVTMTAVPEPRAALLGGVGLLLLLRRRRP